MTVSFPPTGLTCHNVDPSHFVFSTDAMDIYLHQIWFHERWCACLKHREGNMFKYFGKDASDAYKRMGLAYTRKKIFPIQTYFRRQ